MLLRIANFFAAPFGSSEWLLNYFGARDVDYTYNSEGAPVLTDQGRTELTAVWRYITSPAYALFSAYRSQEFATVSHAAEAAMLAAIEPDPTQGFYSPTAATHGALAKDTFTVGVSDIVQGRRPIGDLDSLADAAWPPIGGPLPGTRCALNFGPRSTKDDNRVHLGNVQVRPAELPITRMTC
jgi:putative aldouronate transport system substrate-binding protein